MGNQVARGLLDFILRQGFCQFSDEAPALKKPKK
jgi:hypothetical protein